MRILFARTMIFHCHYPEHGKTVDRTCWLQTIGRLEMMSKTASRAIPATHMINSCCVWPRSVTKKKTG
uniref:Uncharacterized protein n=1 Tax=Anopheles quadriannulatus TaxID=34691 RepID=A0A182XQH3_ANOQN